MAFDSHGRGVEKSTLVHAAALQRPSGIKQLVSCCDIVKPKEQPF